MVDCTRAFGKVIIEWICNAWDAGQCRKSKGTLSEVEEEQQDSAEDSSSDKSKARAAVTPNVQAVTEIKAQPSHKAASDDTDEALAEAPGNRAAESQGCQRRYRRGSGRGTWKPSSRVTRLPAEVEAVGNNLLEVETVDSYCWRARRPRVREELPADRPAWM